MQTETHTVNKIFPRKEGKLPYFEVPSNSRPIKHYVVTDNLGMPIRCTCEWWFWNQELCTHMKSVIAEYPPRKRRSWLRRSR